MLHDILASSRRKRRQKFFWKTSLALLAIFLFLAGIVGFFYIPKFRINDISIEGTNVLDKGQLKEEVIGCLKGKFLKIFPYDNIFILPKAEIAAGLLQKFPILEKAIISRDFPQKISVLLEERKPEALWCISRGATSTNSDKFSEEECAFMDEKGFIFQPAPSFSGAIFIKFLDERQEPAAIGKKAISETEFQKLLSFKDLLNKNNMEVVKIALKNNEQYEVYLKEDWYILLNSENEPIPSFNNLELVLGSTIKEKRPGLEYIDLRSGNKVFFKYK